MEVYQEDINKLVEGLSKEKQDAIDDYITRLDNAKDSIESDLKKANEQLEYYKEKYCEFQNGRYR